MNTTPQGWYRDPADRTRVRWFDGQTWTADNRPAPDPGSGPPPPRAPNASPARPAAAVALQTERASTVPTPHSPPVGLVIPVLEPDEPDEHEDLVAEPVAVPVAEPEPIHEQQETEPQHGQGNVRPVPVQPFSSAAPPPMHGGFTPPTTPAPHPYGAEYAPASTAQDELPPYVTQRPQTPFGQPPAAFGQPPASLGQVPAPFGQAPAAFGQAPGGYPPPTMGTAPSPAQPASGWQGGPQPWQAPAKKMSTAKVVLIVLASVFVGLIMLGIVAAIAIPVFLDQRAKAAASGLDEVTCEQVADYAVQLSAAGQSPDVGPLVSMTEVSLAQDGRSVVRLPAAGDDPAFVMSCVGTGTKPDGTTAPVTANLYVDSTAERLVAYAWNQ